MLFLLDTARENVERYQEAINFSLETISKEKDNTSLVKQHELMLKSLYYFADMELLALEGISNELQEYYLLQNEQRIGLLASQSRSILDDIHSDFDAALAKMREAVTREDFIASAENLALRDAAIKALIRRFPIYLEDE